MPFPAILQPQQMSSSRSSLKKTVGRSAPRPPAFEEKTTEDKEELSNSWPSATLRRHLARRQRTCIVNPQQQENIFHPAKRFLDQVPKGITRSCESVMHQRTAALARSRQDLTGDLHTCRTAKEIFGEKQPGPQEISSHDSMPNLHQNPRQHKLRHQSPNTAPHQQSDVPFNLCLAPEAIHVIQKRNLEKQFLQKQQQRGLQGNTKRIFARSPVRCPRTRSDLPQRYPGQRALPDVRELVKISLLNDKHRYDDEEYEEDDWWFREGNGVRWSPDEGLVRRCTEWLRGVEIATSKDGNLHEKLQTLPHLNSY